MNRLSCSLVLNEAQTCIQNSVNCEKKFVFWLGLQSTLSSFANFFLQAIPVVRGELFSVLLVNFEIMLTQN